MKRDELIEALESDAIEIDEEISSTNTPEPGNSEAIRIAVAKIKEKRTKNGKVYGVKDKEGNPHKRLTASMQLFVNHLLAGDTKLMAYRKAYNVKTENDASVIKGDRGFSANSPSRHGTTLQTRTERQD
jgi:hypothetical protein